MLEISDPFSTNSSTLIFQKDVLCQIRRSDDPDTTILEEYLNIRLISDFNSQIIIASSDKDLFFSYYMNIDQEQFIEIKTKQNIMITFQDFSSFIAKLVNQSIKDGSIKVVFIIDEQGQCRIKFIENFKGYKFVDILDIEIQIMPEQLLRQDITYKYLSLKQSNIQLSKQVHDLQRVSQ
ncbi:Centriolar protein SAS N-terminal domain-containing protein [Spironucleus salmonicida]|uniref:Centriolar protein SAS N-terminal domain-containing protein n=1 Tax=Spironucleus salmonicida TaxID=348837 RepID=A0A9P8LUF7_9EUKA|nr:Centriolar protein SAS N-terminal domain-containing protein [Spironucleus salmonicida]